MPDLTFSRSQSPLTGELVTRAKAVPVELNREISESKAKSLEKEDKKETSLVRDHGPWSDSGLKL